MSTRVLALVGVVSIGACCAAALAEPVMETNSIGMKLVRIDAGEFEMGVDSVPLPPALTKGASGVTYDRTSDEGDYDETPVHRVTISKPFLMGESEVTVEQFRQFREDFSGSDYWRPSASGVSWNDAVAFCEWLSRKEGKTYRLPTEAEWEYACRAGTRTPFGSGTAPPAARAPNAWGVRGMHDGVPEWCLDWHGRYTSTPQTDPVGPAHGIARVIRGGGLDFRQQSTENDTGKKMPAELPYFRRSANRASLPPSFSSASGHVGFRVVQAEIPSTAPTPEEPRPFMLGVTQEKPDLTAGPDSVKPFYRTRPMFPNLGEEDMRSIGWKAGLAPGLGTRYHNSAVAVCDNGDLVAAYYNTMRWEDDPEQTVLTMRLRYGTNDWDDPEPWPDFADAADAAPVFWNDGNGTLWLFFGSPRLLGGPPFWFTTSTDNGQSWSEVRAPKLEGPVGPYTSQPINSVMRDRDGTIFLAVDGEGATTVLFATTDNGKTWRDTGGRTMGRHTSFILGADGTTLIGYGGKNSNLNGFMPMSVSRDGGRTFEHSPTEFMPLASGQRPSVIRLASGRLFLVADTLSSKVPGGRTASYVALSGDEGKTWIRRTLPINSTVGYVTATQAPNGVIHIVTSKTQPVALHIELNEAWIDQGGEPTTGPYGVAFDARRTALDPSGQKLWECAYAGGMKIGTETFWNPDGSVRLQKTYADDGTSTWRSFVAGKPIAESRWTGKTLVEFKLIP
ncbi:MAG: SUMF1/EgtB/PvdO family nonheme iron enzyme [Tepidisphaeraceae bacterium]